MAKSKKHSKKEDIKILAAKLNESAKLFKAAKDIYSTLEFKECLKTIMKKVIGLLEVEIGSLMLVDRKNNQLTMEVAHGLPEEVVKSARVKLGEGIAGWIAERGRPLLIKDIRQDKRFSKNRRGGRYKTESLLSVPLKLDGEVIGVINVNNKRRKDIFKEEDLELLSSLATQAATAIYNATRYRDALDASEMKLQFIANVSHELRTPLACIKEALALMDEGLTGEISPTQEKFLRIARQNMDRLSRLVNEVLDFSKAHFGKAQMHRSLISVVGLIKNVLDAFKLEAEYKKIDVKIDYTPNFPNIWADGDKIAQVLTNLIGNAIKFTPLGGRVEIEAKNLPKEIEVAVTDTGPGISKEEQSKLFTKFEQLNKNVAEGIKGTGLGLFIAKELVELHKGRIWFESKLGEGSKFYFALPKDIRSR